MRRGRARRRCNRGAGPGPARRVDGLPRFDLTRFDPRYFSRLRARVRAAGARGIYVSIMLFEGWGLVNHGPWRWAGHPFHEPNNVNGVEGDLDGNGTGIEINTLASRGSRRSRRPTSASVVDTVYDLDNVLFEIANESGWYSTAWQYRMIRAVKAHERRKGKRRHPVGMTFQHPHGSNANLYRSPADWISPFGQHNRYLHDPPVGARAQGQHLRHRPPLRPLRRRHLPVAELPARPQRRSTWTTSPTRREPARPQRHGPDPPVRAAARPAADAAAPELASTSYASPSPGFEYLVYQPRGGRSRSTSAARATLRGGVVRARPAIARSAGTRAGRLEASRSRRRSRAQAVLYLRRA